MTSHMPHQVVRASAGSGKTFELTSRYIRLLHHGQEPASILATTFTRKAAGEILQRLLARLAEAAQNPTKAAELGRHIGDSGLTAEQCRALLAGVCRSLHSVNICTLDSFFSRVATCFHHELGLPPSPNMVGEDDPAARQLRSQAIDAMLADHDFDLLLNLMQRLYHDSAQRGVTEFIDTQVRNLYEVYRAEVDETGEPNRKVWHTLAPRARPDQARVKEAENALAHAAKCCEKPRLANALQQHVETFGRGDWPGFLGGGLTPKILDGTLTYYRAPIPAELVKILTPLIEDAQARMVDEVIDRTAAMFELVNAFDSHYTRLREASRTLLFADLPHRLAQRLPQRDDLYYRLDARVQHLLLDEFQDTSVQQWSILRPLASEITSHFDEPRSLFCVGDAKQAIYGWRGGCAEIFEQLENGLGLPSEAFVSHHHSYRSSQVVLDAVNGVFRQLADAPCMAELGDTAGHWQRRFTPHEARRQLPGFVELLTTSPRENTEPTEADNGEGEAVMPIGHLAFAGHRIADLAHEAPDKTIGVLVCTNRWVGQIIHELRNEQGLDASGEGGNVITDDPAVLAVLSALTMADHPGHSAAAFHVLNSPLGQVVGLQSIEAAHVAAVALAIRGKLLARGYGEVIGDWARQLASSCDKQGVIRLTQLVELADRYDPDLTLRPRNFVTFVQFTPVQEPTPARVRVMTIHAAKGLEFDIVVLPELRKSIGRVANEAVLIARDKPTDPARAIFGGTNKYLRQCCPQLEQAYQQQQARRVNDDLCMLYVAMTRPRHALHLLIEPAKPKTDRSPSSMGCCFEALLRQKLAQVDDHYKGDQALYQHGDPAWHGVPTPARKSAKDHVPAPPRVLRLPMAKASRSRRQWPTTSPSSLKAGDKTHVNELLALDTSPAIVRGTIMHGWFEQIEWPETIPDDQTLLALARQLHPVASAKWLEELLAEFHRMRRMPETAAALARPGDDVLTVQLWRERAFAARLDGRLLRGRFDRVVILSRDDQPVAATVLDFKTDALRPGDSPQTLVDLYRPQMRAYRRVLAGMLALPETAVETKLLLLSRGTVHEV